MKRFELSVLVLSICVLGMGLTACGRKKVVYTSDNDNTVQTETDADATANDEPGSGVGGQLGLGDKRGWKETIHYVHGAYGELDYEEYDIEVNVSINIPDTDTMYMMSGEEWYLSPEDKKKILTGIVDESSIKRDIEQEYTKEYYEEEAESLRELQTENTGYGEGMQDEEEVYKQSINDLASYYEKKAETAPSKEDLHSIEEDYSGSAYMGSRDGVKYDFKFYDDKERKRSGFYVSRNEEDDMNVIVQEKSFEFTEENSIAKAEEICSDIGLDGMKVRSIIKNETDYSDSGEKREYYIIRLGRDVSGVPVDIYTYAYDSNIAGNTDDYRVRVNDLGYSGERVDIILDEYGLYSISAFGIIKNCNVEKPVKLLGFEQIKDVIREELSTRDVRNEIQDWKQLDLIYLRIANKEEEGKVSYIPVWRLSTIYDPGIYNGIRNYGDYINMSYMLLFVNALDGSIMDLDDVGAGCIYMSTQGFGEYE